MPHTFFPDTLGYHCTVATHLFSDCCPHTLAPPPHTRPTPPHTPAHHTFPCPFVLTVASFTLVVGPTFHIVPAVTHIPVIPGLVGLHHSCPFTRLVPLVPPVTPLAACHAATRCGWLPPPERHLPTPRPRHTLPGGCPYAYPFCCDTTRTTPLRCVFRTRTLPVRCRRTHWVGLCRGTAPVTANARCPHTARRPRITLRLPLGSVPFCSLTPGSYYGPATLRPAVAHTTFGLLRSGLRCYTCWRLDDYCRAVYAHFTRCRRITGSSFVCFW